MEKKPLFRRLLTIETLSSAVVGACAPYLLAFLIEIAPTRVPLWSVVVSILGCAATAHGLRALVERHHRAQQRLERIERTMAAIAPSRLSQATTVRAETAMGSEALDLGPDPDEAAALQSADP